MCLLDAAVSPCSNAPRSMKLERCPDRLHQLCQPLGATRALIFRRRILILKPNYALSQDLVGMSSKVRNPLRNKDESRCCSMPYVLGLPLIHSCHHYSRVETFSLLFTSLPLPSQSEWESRLLGYDRVARLGCSRNPDHEYHIWCVVLLNCFIAQRT